MTRRKSYHPHTVFTLSDKRDSSPIRWHEDHEKEIWQIAVQHHLPKLASMTASSLAKVYDPQKPFELLELPGVTVKDVTGIVSKLGRLAVYTLEANRCLVFSTIDI